MKKLSTSTRDYLKRLNIRERISNASKARVRRKRIKSRIIKNRDPFRAYQIRKANINTQIHRNFDYTDPSETVKVEGYFGLERQEDVDYYLTIASKTIDFNSKELIIDLSACTRIWPSSITLFSSLYQWVELSHKNRSGIFPKILASYSDDKHVNDYLEHSGFYKYIRLNDNEKEKALPFEDNETIKIKHEKNQYSIEEREDEIVNLLTTHSTLNEEQIEKFNCIVLTEAFSNVTEHGFAGEDTGWWVTAQYHKTHGMISLNIADNGIGIRHTLTIGPQKAAILKRITNKSTNDGKFILMAMKENTSGTVQASIKDDRLINSGYQRGARRGNGLERIIDACVEMKIRFALLSHYGYVFRNEKGDVVESGAKKNRVFAGTLYNFIIPAKKLGDKS